MDQQAQPMCHLEEAAAILGRSLRILYCTHLYIYYILYCFYISYYIAYIVPTRLLSP
jgi:hypothetical protein